MRTLFLLALLLAQPFALAATSATDAPPPAPAGQSEAAKPLNDRVQQMLKPADAKSTAARNNAPSAEQRECDEINAALGKDPQPDTAARSATSKSDKAKPRVQYGCVKN
ncbi:hypothetical protein [Chitinimonas sp.]|uniref:hypothetical protein n=1 Tax=Chitinimonas sp. TaxID=1934313 RepID=UPI0035B255A8